MLAQFVRKLVCMQRKIDLSIETADFCAPFFTFGAAADMIEMSVRQQNVFDFQSQFFRFFEHTRLRGVDRNRLFSVCGQ